MKRIKSHGFFGHIIDGIYSRPDKVRSKMLNLEFTPPNISGVGGPAWRSDLENSPELIVKLEAIWGFKIEPLRTEVRYTLESAKSVESARNKNICHNDYHTSEYTAVIYLSRQKDCKGGTNFFRHMPSNTTEYNPSLGEMDYANAPDWELYYTSEMAFNRLATYKSAIFHGIMRPFFGTEKENARLVQTFRFNRKI